MVSPPADRRVYLFTVKPQWDEGGSFKIWKSPSAFAQWIPGVSLEAAQAALGASEEQGVLPAHDTEALLDAVRQLVPAEVLSQAIEESRDALADLGVAGIERIPNDVLRVIDLRAGGTPDLALRFAAGALALDGVFLRAHQGKDDPRYFYVRHPQLPSVAAYVTPRPGDIRIEYRLPGTHETYGVGIARKHALGIVLNLKDEAGLEVALRLLQDALDSTD